MSKRIMVIDNDQSIRKLFEFFLTDRGWEVFSYDYAHLDFTMVQQLTPDLIILDLNMVQTGSGWSFLQLLKMEDATAAIPVLVCTTATTLTLEIEGYLAARHISIVRKPFDPQVVLLTINKALTANLVLPILVVEDNEDLADTVKTVLEFEGYLVVIASNGQLALDAVAKAHHALILLDLSMPVMTGLEFLAAYAHQPGEHSPVIIFSAQADIITEHLPSFVMNILSKPYKLGHLLTLVSEYAKPILQ